MTSQVMDRATLGTSASSESVSKGRLWAARVIGGIAVLFLLFDGVSKVMRVPQSVQGTAELGFSPAIVPTLGVILLACLALYVIPRTAVLGAILLTGYLGGAVAAQVRLGHPLLGFTLFPVYIALFVWGALSLRDDRVRALMPLRSAR